MGTRADLYIGRGAQAEWLGSVAWDGYPEGIQSGQRPYGVHGKNLLTARTPEAFRTAAAAFLASRDDATRPEQGWPWPWEDSRTTDYAYAFDEGQVWASCFGRAWFDPLAAEREPDDGAKVAVFPDMTRRARVTMGPRSGLIVLGVPGEE